MQVNSEALLVLISRHALHMRLSVRLTVRPSVRPSVSPSVRPSVCQSVSQSVCPFVRPFIRWSDTIRPVRHVRPKVIVPPHMSSRPSILSFL